MDNDELLLTDLIDIEMLQKIQDSFSMMTGLAAVTVDVKGNAVTKGTCFSDFCAKYTRNSELGCKLCCRCDAEGASLALKNGHASTYFCHAGLVDFAAPIIADGKLVGGFIGGQVLTEKPDYEKFRKTAEKIDVDPDEYIEAAKKIKIIPKSRIDECTASLYNIASVISTIAYNSYQLRNMNTEIEKAASMKSDFLANMSHEIRTPMNAVIGMAEMALREDLPPAARDFIHQIKSSGKSLLTIINDILDFSKIESGKMDIIFTEYDPFSLVNDVANIIMTRIGEKDVELIIDVDPTIPKRLMGDNIRIKQIILNLANNAAKFTQTGQVVLHLSYTIKSDFELDLHGSIEDTGIGIKKSDLGKLFQSFQQVDSKRNRNIEGTGLGLAITKNLLSLMFGSIEVESEYGKGSKFSFTLPQRIVSSDPAICLPDTEHIHAAGFISNPYESKHIAAESERIGVSFLTLTSEAELTALTEQVANFLFIEHRLFSSNIEEFIRNHPDITAIVIIEFSETIEYDIPNVLVVHKPLYSYNLSMIYKRENLHILNSGDDLGIDFIAPDAEILIVDDNAINLTVAEGLLEPLKMKIDTASGGQEAIKKISEKKYDLIFMDHMMPEIDGVETTHIIRRFHPEYDMIPIIALTANVVEETRFMFLAEGMNDFVAKPIELRMIVSVIKRWLPAEKLKPITAESKSAPTAESGAGSESDSLSIGDLDTKAALELLGTEKLFWKVLKDYYNVIDKKIHLILTYEEQEDWKNYTTEVHALKSASKQIGAMSLSEKAAKLEKAGNEQDAAMIHEHTGEMIEQYRQYRDLLAPYFVEKKKENSDAPALDHNQLKEYLETIKNAIDDLDLDVIEATVQKFDNYSLTEEQQQRFEPLKTTVEDIDFESCNELLDAWLSDIS